MRDFIVGKFCNRFAYIAGVMKKVVLGFIVLVLLSSCNNKKAKIDPFEPLTNLVDSVKGFHQEDSVIEEQIEDPVPMKADESFDDFIYSFASDDKMQHQRTVFPLPYYMDDTATRIEESNWEQDVLFTRQEYYTLLFDKEEDMDLAQDTALNSVQFEWIYLEPRRMKKYYFQRTKGAWILEAINEHKMKETENESFADFFYRFANDSVFQCERINEPLTFVTTDPDDDFSIMETTLELNQWLAFKPVLPVDKLSNINYGQTNVATSRIKILALKGIGNGFSNTLYFKRIGSKWKLYKFEDLSN